MARPQEHALADYLYAIVKNPPARLSGLAGVEDQPITLIAQGEFTVVASPVTAPKLRPQRKHLLAHQQVLNALLPHTTPLPFAFGTIVASPKALGQLFKGKSRQLRQQYDRVADRVEMSVRLRWDVPDLMAFVMDRRPELVEQRDALLQRGQTGRDAAMALGQAIEAAITDLKAQDTARLLVALEPVCAEVRTLPAKAEAEVAQLACLVHRERTAAIEEAINNVAASWSDAYALHISGPMAPYSFVTWED